MEVSARFRERGGIGTEVKVEYDREKEASW